MFYTVVSVDGFCYIPSVTVTDTQGLALLGAEVIELPKITSDTVTAMLNAAAGQAMAVPSIEQAIDLAESLYKKLPRYRRQLGFEVNDPLAPRIKYQGMTIFGSGTLKEEVADKYW